MERIKRTPPYDPRLVKGSLVIQDDRNRRLRDAMTRMRRMLQRIFNLISEPYDFNHYLFEIPDVRELS